MKTLLTFTIMLLGALLISGSYRSEVTTANAKGNSVVLFFTDTIPAVNMEIVDFINTKIKKKVGRGECWDLAAEALNTVGAKWDGNFNFGKEINPALNRIFPGDIIQFKGVKVKYTKDGMNYTENMPKHTAVIYAVKGNGIFDLAHQNTGSSGKKVGISELNVKNIVKGKYKIYRPIR